jgi:polyphenol oxidase
LRWREQDGVRWLEADLPGARSAFSTRVGGVSEPPYASLNLAILSGDDRLRVRHNRRRLAAALGLDPAGILIGRQVHGTDVARHRAAPRRSAYADPGPHLPRVDGQATEHDRLAPLVFAADCLPVALTGTRGVAMIHCGWRGLAGGIVDRGVKEVGAIAAAVGPGIGPCCYEVGEEVLAAFRGLGPDVARDRMLNLRSVVLRLLRRAGVAQVEVSELCTSCHPELFFSHRRDGERTGRQAGVAWLSDEPQGVTRRCPA